MAYDIIAKWCGYYFPFKFLLGLSNTFPNSKIYVMEPKGFMGYTKRGSAVNWVLMGINNTPPTAWTKIIEPMLFVDYPKHGLFSL